MPDIKNHSFTETAKTSINKVARYIEDHSDESLTLDALATIACLSPHYLQRLFKETVGVSPKVYQDACRLRTLRRSLKNQKPVVISIFDSGFGSTSRVYESIDSRLGMTPKQFRDRGRGLDISYAHCETRLGQVVMGATDRGLCWLQIGDSTDTLVSELNSDYHEANVRASRRLDDDQFCRWMEALRTYVGGLPCTPHIPLDVWGTSFQVRVWRFLQQIPVGETKSYAEVAARIGAPKAVRAVASACAANNVAILIPCHRVIRGNGNLGGYRWGIDRKSTLLKIETDFDSK